MHLIFHLIERKLNESKRVKLELDSKLKVKEIKQQLVNLFNLQSLLLSKNFNLYLKLHGTELKDEWSIQHIPPGSTVKCYVDAIRITDYYVYILFQKRILELINSKFDPQKTLVIELREHLSNLLGIPLSVFRLKSSSNCVMFDQHFVSDYKLTRNSQFILETWQGWDLFLEYCIKGFTKHLVELFSKDELIRQYQIKVALYIGSFYGNYDVVNKMMKLGARPDEPVGTHPCRMWCQSATFVDKLPLHVAARNMHFKVILLMIKNRIHITENKSSSGLPLWRVVMQCASNATRDEIKKRKEIAKFLLLKRASLKFELAKDVRISICLYSKLKYWAESAQERVYRTYGFRYTSLKQRPFYKSSLVGPRVLVDGYNNDFTEFRAKVNPNQGVKLNNAKLPQLKRTNSITNMTHSSYMSLVFNDFYDANVTNVSTLDSTRTDHKHTSNRKYAQSYAAKKQTELKKETRHLFEKYNHGHTMNETARFYLDETDRFKSKSWLQKVKLSSRMAQSNVLERLRNSTL